MQKIIGGEMSIELCDMKVMGSLAEDVSYSTGRGALAGILKDIEETERRKRVLVPDYLCPSIINTIRNCGWEYEFYHVEDINCHISFDKTIIKTNVVLLINYFGICNFDEEIEKIREQIEDAIIILDQVQAFYDFGKVKGVNYEFVSYRKWFPCPDGAKIIKNNEVYFNRCELSPNEFASYKIAGNTLKSCKPYIDDELILDLLEKGENKLDENYMACCSDFSRERIPLFDYKHIAETRRKNARMLHEALEELGIVHGYNEKGVPLFIPILVKNRDEVRKRMFSSSIFTPVHWPIISSEISGINVLYEEELSLICDQRYDEKDMERQIEVLKKLI